MFDGFNSDHDQRKKSTSTKKSWITARLLVPRPVESWLANAIAEKTLKLCGIIIIATSVHHESPRTRIELSTRIVFHVTLTSVDSNNNNNNNNNNNFIGIPIYRWYYLKIAL